MERKDMNRFQILLDGFARQRGFIKYQIDSYNRFVNYTLQQIIDEIGEIVPESERLIDFKVKLGRIRIGKPSVKEADGSYREILPMEARLRDVTYAAPIFLEMIPTVAGVEQERAEVKIGELPVMVKSELCPLSMFGREELIQAGEDSEDPGGYFIINGTERVLVLVEEIAPNKIILENVRRGAVIQAARINSERVGWGQRHVIERKKDGMLTISFANIKKLPLIVLMMALGLDTDKVIIEAITAKDKYREDVYTNLYEIDVTNMADALEFMGRAMKVFQKEYRRERAEQVIDKYLLPHIGQRKEDRRLKALYLGGVARKLMELAEGKIKEDDIDHYSNKRLRMSGDLLEVLFRSIMLGRWGLIARIVYNYQKIAKRGKLPSVGTIVESNVLTNNINSALATGLWVGGRTGVSQRLERANFLRTVAHLRNVISPLSTAQEHFEARELHSTHWGRLCPSETPEGPTIGLRKYLATMASITTGINEEEVKESLVKVLDKFQGSKEFSVFVNGAVIGRVGKPQAFVQEIKRQRRNGSFSDQINVKIDNRAEEIIINTDSGRVRRPLIVAQSGKAELTEEHIKALREGKIGWEDLISKGIIEYLDADEEENAFIAMSDDEVTPEHSHAEINPVTIMGLPSSMIPFAEYNRGDRVNFGAKMSGQSLGMYSLNYLLRVDTKSNMLSYPQTPLVSVDSYPILGIDRHPAGQNVVIALLCHGGYNMEDSVMINKASIERGFGRSYFFRTYQTEEMRYRGGQEDVVKVPEKDIRGYRSEKAYSTLTEDGLIPPEMEVGGGDVLVGKTSPLRFLGGGELMTGIQNRRETSLTLRHGEKGVVEKVLLSETQNGNRLVKVTVRDERILELGDKLASRHGQKGVIGLIVSPEDMPFTSNGIAPDIIMNPHSIPSRLTVGQLLEMLGGKVGALSGRSINGTPFNGEKEKDLRQELLGVGFRSDGKERLYNGVTGEILEVEIFMGIIYYQKLEHMVANKIHARSRGPVALLTKQPTEGRAKEGGLRLGEMEKDCLLAHGASLLLNERFSADHVSVPICDKCGLLAIKDWVKGRTFCHVCGGTKVKEVGMSYAFKLLLDELESLCIYPRIKVEER